MYIHPILIHYPIAFYSLELGLLAFWYFKNENSFRDFARLVFLLAYLGTWLAIAAGFFDAGGWKPVFHFPKIRRHFFAGLSVAIFYSWRLVTWRAAGSEQKKFHLLQSLTGMILVALTAYWGGRLVYE